MTRSHAPKLFVFMLFFMILGMPAKSGADEVVGTRQTLELVVSVMAEGLGGLLKDEPSHRKHIEMVKSFIRPVRFFSDSSGYFFVYDTKGVCVAHATQPELVGENLYNLRDAKGQYVIKNLISVALKGGGFVEYNWKSPLANEMQDKLGYVALIPGTTLFIGSGIYFSSLQ